jgi:hypothetical protein
MDIHSAPSLLIPQCGALVFDILAFKVIEQKMGFLSFHPNIRSYARGFHGLSERHTLCTSEFVHCWIILSPPCLLMQQQQHFSCLTR